MLGEEQDFNKLINIDRYDGQKLSLESPQTFCFTGMQHLSVALSFRCTHSEEEKSPQKEMAGWWGGRRKQKEILRSDIERGNPGIAQQSERSGKRPSERGGGGERRERGKRGERGEREVGNTERRVLGIGRWDMWGYAVGILLSGTGLISFVQGPGFNSPA